MNNFQPSFLSLADHKRFSFLWLDSNINYPKIVGYLESIGVAVLYNKKKIETSNTAFRIQIIEDINSELLKNYNGFWMLFSSNSAQYLEAWSRGAVGVFTQNNFKEQIASLITRLQAWESIFNTKLQNLDEIEVVHKGLTETITKQQVAWLESFGNSTFLWLFDVSKGKRIVPLSLTKTLEYFNSGDFVLINRKHAINKNYIEFFRNQKVGLQNGIELQVARRRFQELKTSI